MFVCPSVYFTFCMSSSSCSSSSLVMLYCCSSTRAKYSMARMDSLSFRVRTMSWNGEKTTVQPPLDKHVSSQSADGRWSNLILLSVSLALGIQTEIQYKICWNNNNVLMKTKADVDPLVVSYWRNDLIMMIVYSKSLTAHAQLEIEMTSRVTHKIQLDKWFSSESLFSSLLKVLELPPPERILYN